MTTTITNNPASTLPKDVRPHYRKTRFMIEQENQRILELYKSGLSHRQIREIIGIAERQYWRRIKQIQETDLEILLLDQTKESRAFLLQRMVEKLQSYEQEARAMAHNKALRPVDRLAAFHLLRQLAADEYSLQTYGPSSFIIPELNDKLPGGDRSTALILRKSTENNETDSTQDTTTDSSRVF